MVAGRPGAELLGVHSVASCPIAGLLDAFALADFAGCTRNVACFSELGVLLSLDVVVSDSASSHWQLWLMLKFNSGPAGRHSPKAAPVVLWERMTALYPLQGRCPQEVSRVCERVKRVSFVRLPYRAGKGTMLAPRKRPRLEHDLEPRVALHAYSLSYRRSSESANVIST